MVCWIFDLDGVVTSIEHKKITNPKLLAYFASFLQQNEPVTINTGRSLPFIRQEVFTPLLQFLQEQNLPENLLDTFFAVGEKGNAWIEEEKDCFDLSTALPQDFSQEVQELVAKEYSDTMFFDTTKKTMISLEMTTGLDPHVFAPAEEKLVPILENMLKAHTLDTIYKLDPNVSSIDIQPIAAGKSLGIQRIFEWLEKENIQPDKYIAFGDSIADLGMGEALQKAGKTFQFIFVGNPDIISSAPAFTITFTKEKYDKGVVEWIEEN